MKNILQINLIKKSIYRILEKYASLITQMQKSNLREWHRVIIFCQSNLGDALFTTPAIRALRQQKPNAQIDLVADVYNSEIYERNPNLDHMMIWDRRLNRKRDFGYLIAKIKEIRFGSYDVAVFLELAPDNYMFQSLVALLAGIKERIGIDPVGMSKFLNKIVSIKEEVYWPIVYGDIVQYIGDSLNGTEMDIFPSKEDQCEVDDLLGELGIKPELETIIAVQTGAMNYGVRKNWGDEKFKELIKRVDREYGPLTFLLTGAKHESERINKILGGARSRGFNISGKLSFRAHAPLLRYCDLLVTNDTAILHLGIINKMPIVAIFGPTGPQKIVPEQYPMIKIVRKELSCSPCYKTNRNCLSWYKCINPIREKCLNDISVDDVVSASSHFLNS